MKKYETLSWSALGCIVLAMLSGCTQEQKTENQARIVCGIRPIGAIVQAILPKNQGFVVDVLLPQNVNAHQFDLSFRQLKLIQDCVVYFGSGLPFERKIAGVCGDKYVESWMASHDLEPQTHQHGEDCSEDPHVWMSFHNSLQIGKNISEKLAKIYPQHAMDIRQNYQAWVTNLTIKQEACRQLLKSYRGRKFYVYHPAFGSFAEEFGLIQCSIERDGKEPSVQHLASIASQMKKDNVKVIYVQYGFSVKMTQVLAATTGAKVRELDQMSSFDKLDQIGAILAEDFR